MNVVVIAEDPTLDAYILGPIIKEMLTEIGRPRAKVIICRDPYYQGIDEVLKKENLETIIRRYPQADLFLLCVDRDGNENRRTALNDREEFCASILQGQQNVVLFAENAWQEVEVWALAGCTDLPGEWHWRDIRAERDPKEEYFEPYVAQKNLAMATGGGRKKLGEQAASRYRSVRQRCPEDIGALEQRLRDQFGRQ